MFNLKFMALFVVMVFSLLGCGGNQESPPARVTKPAKPEVKKEEPREKLDTGLIGDPVKIPLAKGCTCAYCSCEGDNLPPERRKCKCTEAQCKENGCTCDKWKKK